MKKFALFFLPLAFLLISLQPSHAADKPNIVFILMDDMGWTDLGCYGSPFYKSPNVDRLAQQGMKFTEAYAACPVCSPTRASILTGKYPARLHLTDWLPGRGDKPNQKLARPQINQQLPLEEVTLAEALKPAGYVCGAFGKWHLGNKGFSPTDQGFDVYVPSSMTGGSPGSNEKEKGEYGITQGAIDFIEANKDKPFFAYVAYHSVHIPLNARSELIAKYEKLRPATGPHTNWVYAAMIDSVDAQIGRLLGKLDELKLAGNTVVFFTSDNGGLAVHEGERTPATSNAPLRDGKGYLHEGGIREPLIVRWPGVIKPQTVCSNAVISIDFFPTILQIAGVTPATNQVIDGETILPLLKQTGVPKPRPFFWHYPHYANQGGPPGGAIREGDFKLIEFYEDGQWELYNLRNDPGETRNLADDNRAQATALELKLDAWRRDVGAQMMLPNPGYIGPDAKEPGEKKGKR